MLRHIHIQYAVDMANVLAHRLRWWCFFLCVWLFCSLHFFQYSFIMGTSQSFRLSPVITGYAKALNISSTFMRSRCLASPSLVPCTQWICCAMQHCAPMFPFIARVLGAGAYDSIRKFAKYSFERWRRRSILGIHLTFSWFDECQLANGRSISVLFVGKSIWV